MFIIHRKDTNSYTCYNYTTHHKTFEAGPFADFTQFHATVKIVNFYSQEKTL